MFIEIVLQALLIFCLEIENYIYLVDFVIRVLVSNTRPLLSVFILLGLPPI